MEADKIYCSNKKLQSLLSFYFLSVRGKSLLAMLSFFLLFLLAYNAFAIFYIQVPCPSPEPAGLSTEKLLSVSSSTKLSSFMVYAVKEQNLVSKPNTQFPIVHKSHKLLNFVNNSVVYAPKKKTKHKDIFKILRPKPGMTKFRGKVKTFFGDKASNSSCKFRFFMTWVSSFESFGARGMYAVESLFKSHPNGCLVIVSDSMDSSTGMQVLRPFWDNGFRVTAISPDFNYLFKNTAAEAWFDRLTRGKISPGEVSLGQNLSNLLRLALLYKFGGIYIDTDVIVLKSFVKLRNAIGAQTTDAKTKNWSRLNNAVMIFDKGHPLLYKFIEEFALTFDGNKWGHNGPYLVSRVVSRLNGRPGYNFTVLPPMAFYPVDWSRIGSFFRGPRNEVHSRWLLAKLGQIRSQSFAIHLWNKQSRRLKVEEGSIVRHLISYNCVFCNSSPLVL